MAPDRRASDRQNAVLRGGPLDGETVVVKTLRTPIDREVDGQIYSYAPTGEVDDEFPTMVVFIYVGVRPAAWLAG